jgi:hypothetical protein
MKTYKVNGLNQSGTGPNTSANIIGSTSIRPLTNYLLFGFRTNPNTTDQQVRCQVGNTTAAGTAGSSPTPKPDDPQDVAAVSTAGITHSAEPTYGATFFMDFDLNQRASKEWGCQDGREFAGAATASNGVAAKMTAVTAAIQMSVVDGWRE